MAADYSRRELLRDALITEFTAISTANGYRTDPKLVSRELLYPKDVTNHPTIMVLIDSEKITGVDTQRVIFDSTVKLAIVGFFSGDMEFSGVSRTPGEMDGEPLLHDLKRVAGQFSLKYVNDGTSKWEVQDWQAFGPVVDRAARQGYVWIEMNVVLFSQDGDF